MTATVVKSHTFQEVTLGTTPCSVMVKDAPVLISFEASGGEGRGMKLYPGDVIPVGAAKQLYARKVTDFAPTLVPEVFE